MDVGGESGFGASDTGSFGIGFGGSSGLAGFGEAGDLGGLLGFSPANVSDAAWGTFFGGLFGPIGAILGFPFGGGGLMSGLSLVAPGWSSALGLPAPSGFGENVSVAPATGAGLGGAGGFPMSNPFPWMAGSWSPPVVSTPWPWYDQSFAPTKIRYNPFTAPVITDPYQRMIGYTPFEAPTFPSVVPNPRAVQKPSGYVQLPNPRIRRKPI